MTTDLLALLVGILGNITSSLVFASPLVTFYGIIKKRTTESFSPVPYITCMLSQALWTYYGIIKPKGLIIASISGVGFIFMMCYLGIFVIFASMPNRMYALKLLTLSLTSFVALFLGTFFGSHDRTRLTIVGFLCAINSVCMFASPLCVMKKVITTKSVEFMPFFLTLSLFANGGTWATYSIIVRDLFMGVPSGLGFLFGVAQLLLYFCYYKKIPKEVNDTKLCFEPVKPPSKGQQPSMEKLEEYPSQIQIQF
ncbi:hypothetical protein GOP47_0005083 [Adiantum capillus-veneris]|uniref:Bidirectional sugar transporter SWEET n=1 Tax=Adiantum capillus-veneris TaxID=13818 RepID=A0A9D4V4H2_ADICA|nr:hypothetical protein GOP47_0005083 [Adiantum capillus-veneris]